MGGNFKENKLFISGHISEGFMKDPLFDLDSDEYRISKCKHSEKGQSLYMAKTKSAQFTWAAARRG